MNTIQKRISLILLTLFSTISYSQATKKITNRALNQDLELCVNDGGATICPIVVDGASGSVNFPNGATGISADVHDNSEAVNLANNPGFETGTANWTASGGTFTTTSVAANVGIGASSGSWDATAGAQTLSHDLVLTPNGLSNRLCHFKFMYKGGDANLSARVVDGSANVLKTVVLKVNATFASTEPVTFACPLSPETVKFELVSTASAAIIYIDKVFFGTGQSGVGSVGGWKQYTDSNVSGGVVAIDVKKQSDNLTLNPTILRATFVPYKDPINDVWRLRFNVHAFFTSSEFLYFTLSGVTFKNNNNFQAVTSFQGNNNTGTSKASTQPNTNRVLYNALNGATVSNVSLSGDVELESKPTWADYDNTVRLISDTDAVLNARFVAKGLTGNVVVTTPIGADIQITGWINTYGNTNFDGSVYTIPTDGFYRISFSGRVISPATYTGDIRFAILKDGARIRFSDVTYSSGKNVYQETSIEDYFIKGQAITTVSGTTSNYTLDLNTETTIFSVVKISEFTSGSMSGAPFASANTYGVVKVAKDIVDQGVATGGSIPITTTGVVLETYTILESGKYFVCGSASYNNSASGGTGSVRFIALNTRINGVNILETLTSLGDTDPNGSDYISMSTNNVVDLVVGEVITLFSKAETNGTVVSNSHSLTIIPVAIGAQ